MKLSDTYESEDGKPGPTDGAWMSYCTQCNVAFLPVSSGTKPKATTINFDDLLSGQGFTGNKEKRGPKTIAEMRKEEMAKEMDPEKLKVRNNDCRTTGNNQLAYRIIINSAWHYTITHHKTL